MVVLYHARTNKIWLFIEIAHSIGIVYFKENHKGFKATLKKLEYLGFEVITEL